MIYGGDYRPDDEPPPEAVLEEKRIVEHQFRRPSPSRWSSSAASTSMRPPVTARPGTSRSLRARATGGSPRRSSHRSSAFGNRRSATVTDRGRTASMPVVPIVKWWKNPDLLKFDNLDFWNPKSKMY
ncbi:Hypothetical protein CINCED_3A021507 [Cinara cedri]|uniref:Uncharacterized protein n=1 Tax=Cinara cedri TaxID=506608 RepID=A0A5E4M751_9HEMI|nr:Hypothetical protein CINCED_3A021507 [Cinara cedri]